MNIRYIENPTEKVQLSVLHADREAAALISSPSEAVRKQAEEMYGHETGEAGGPGKRSRHPKRRNLPRHGALQKRPNRVRNPRENLPPGKLRRQ
ncbi:hypothetical protein NXY47_00040 [Bacteroides fragilis]|nr:hypothetical protein [Bacteroides fragilis]